MTWYVVLAGGGGTRLWPMSTPTRPKQFLPLLPNGATLLGATLARIDAPLERVLIVTTADQLDQVRAIAPGLPLGNLVIEPVGRSTAPAIGLAAREVARRDPDGVMVVLPSDHHVARPDVWRSAIATAVSACGDHVVTIGLTPTRPETGFGYLAPGPGGAVREVLRFVEKPDRDTAAAYIADGYLWNAGMFVARAQRLLDAIAAHLPALAAILDGRGRYEDAPAVSIDHGVIEKLGPGEVLVVPADLGWSDVGSWAAVGEVLPADADGNVIVGAVEPVDAHGSVLVNASSRTVAVLGVQDLVVVVTEEAVLVAPKDRAQDVREVVRRLRP